LLDKCLEMKIYLVMNIKRKFNMLIDTKEVLRFVLQQGDTLKSLIVGKCSIP
jgi:hypothetical protein